MIKYAGQYDAAEPRNCVIEGDITYYKEQLSYQLAAGLHSYLTFERLEYSVPFYRTQSCR